MIGLAVSFVVALAVTWLATPRVLALATRCGAMAVPRDRDVHEKAVPRWGGIAIYLGVLAAVLLTVTYRHVRTEGEHGWTRPMFGALIATTFIGLIGLLDDLVDLRPAWQALAILAAGAVLLAFGVRIEGVGNPFVAQQAGGFSAAAWISLSVPASCALTLFWFFVVTKTVDAIDGLDGLAAGVCAISAATLALLAAASKQADGPTLALYAAAVVGACAGFLRYNYRPARIFMSTVGAQFLGLTLAAISVMGTFKIAAAVSVMVPILVLGVPILDYGVVLWRRLTQGAPLTAADRRHFHHRLLDRGLSHTQAVWIIYACTAALCVAAVALFHLAR